MTREEATKEIEKAFEPAFANYIITALTEGATVSDKEPLKPMIEIDLYSVIKQKYIEREVLDKIRAEIKDYFSITCDGNCDSCNRVVKNPCGESVDGAWVLHIIDKYKAESEETESEETESEEEDAPF